MIESEIKDSVDKMAVYLKDRARNYNKIFAILIDYVNPIAGAILILSVVYVLYRLLQGR